MSKYTIKWEAIDRLIVLKPIGFFLPKEFDAYRRDILAAVDRAGAPFDMLVDMTARGPQAAHATPHYQELNEELATRGLRHIVVAGASPIVGLQFKRLAKTAPPHFVDSMEEGRRWLKTTSLPAAEKAGMIIDPDTLRSRVRALEGCCNPPRHRAAGQG